MTSSVYVDVVLQIHVDVQAAPEDGMSWMSLKINAEIRKACYLGGSIVPFNRERVLSHDLSRGYDKVIMSQV